MATKVSFPIPQDKIEESFVWRDWFQKLSNRAFGTASTLDVPIQAIYGGTGITSYNVGDILYSPSSNLLTRLPAPSVPSYLAISGSGVPFWDPYPRIEAYDLSTSISIGTTPALLLPASTVSGSSGITYDNTTGIFTFTKAGTYSLAISLNITTSRINQFVYVYAENNTGSGWVVNANSGKDYDLIINQTVQYTNPQAVYRTAGQQVRYWIYSNDIHSTLVTETLPGGVGAYVPAIRIQYAG
jgi:hypothetical protein